MRRWHDVGSLEELERDGRVVARIGGREIGVLTGPEGHLVAVRNRCPHHGAPLCLGALRERLAGEPGRYRTSGRVVLRCPWHGWEFDVETGRCADEPSLRAAVYAARVEDGRVLVEA
jgi:3-phenylpropionate/trans-cinnamate dioxygenase ferredoxin subunit